MTHDLTDAVLAADCFLILERSAPGATLEPVWEIAPHHLKAVAAAMAVDLGAEATPTQRRRWLKRYVNRDAKEFADVSARYADDFEYVPGLNPDEE